MPHVGGVASGSPPPSKLSRAGMRPAQLGAQGPAHGGEPAAQDMENWQSLGAGQSLATRATVAATSWTSRLGLTKSLRSLTAAPPRQRLLSATRVRVRNESLQPPQPTELYSFRPLLATELS